MWLNGMVNGMRRAKPTDAHAAVLVIENAVGRHGFQRDDHRLFRTTRLSMCKWQDRNGKSRTPLAGCRPAAVGACRACMIYGPPDEMETDLYSTQALVKFSSRQRQFGVKSCEFVCASGSRRETRVPLSGPLSSSMDQPYPSQIFFTIDRPMPKPCADAATTSAR
jgi:hypothetical protein